MNILFSKFSANGNDFIVIDNRNYKLDISDQQLWRKLCDRREGIGADGVLLMDSSAKADFKMYYLNADGGEVEMCGNGARTITKFAHNALNSEKKKYNFETFNGIYQCELDSKWGLRLAMHAPADIGKISLEDFSKNFTFIDSLYLNTGVPHSVFELVDELEIKNIDVESNGKLVRNDNRFKAGTNVNFICGLHNRKQEIFVRTFERGVEAETMSCGTGCVASALFYARKYHVKESLKVHTRGGVFFIEFNEDFSKVFLCGQSTKIFDGNFELNNFRV